MTQITGDLNFAMDTNLYSTFVQDDWQIAPKVKVLYGVRYDLYQYPDRAGRPRRWRQTQNFNIDKNNFGPRVGVAWSLDDKTVLRASTGIMYDQPILGGYEQALQLSGSPKAPAYTFSRPSAGAPAFPSPVSAAGTLAVQSPWAVDPNFDVAHTWQTNIQVERSLGRDYTASVGFMYANGDNLPVVTDINLINPVGTLADGRPIYSGTVSAATPRRSALQPHQQVQSIGDSTFKGLTLQMSKRLSKGLTFNVQYVVGKGTRQHAAADAADGAGRNRPLGSEQPRSRSRPEPARHAPQLLRQRRLHDAATRRRTRVVRALLNGNQIGVLLQFNSGLPLNIRSNLDLNGDGVTSDRPLDVARNSLYLPMRKNVDLRYTRIIPIAGTVRGRGHRRAEERVQHRADGRHQHGRHRRTRPAIRSTPIPTDPYGFSGASGYEQRKFQLGFKVPLLRARRRSWLRAEG